MRPVAPFHAALDRLPDPEGAWLDHDEVERAIDAHLSFPSCADIDSARFRLQAAVRPGVPREVAILADSLGVA